MTGKALQPSSSEAAPVIRGLRAMAIVRWILLLLTLLAAVGTWWIFVLQPEQTVQGPNQYYCPMHPQIQSPTPGTCPICFMKLEPIPEERMAGASPIETIKPPTPQPGTTPSGLSNVMLTLERRQAVDITTTQASQRKIAQELRLPAVIEAPEKAISEVRVRTAGFVERVAPVETGTRVRAGQPLLWVYSPEILRAQEELLLATHRPQQSTDKEQSEYHLINPLAEAARQQLLLLGFHASDLERILRQGKTERLMPVRASTSGIVTGRNVAVGMQAMPEMTLFQITDLSRVWVTATVSSQDLPLISKQTNGQYVSRTDNKTYDVNVLLIEPRVASETRTARVRFSAKNPDISLLPGEIGTVVVSSMLREYILVPRDAVIDVGMLQYVFVETSPGLFAPRVVEVGPLIGEERAVLRGLAVGESVVSRGAFVLDSESRLQAAVAPRSTDKTPSVSPTAHTHGNHGDSP
jgi:Cu(I)/Ag(I) efflux system membrane fusion protein